MDISELLSSIGDEDMQKLRQTAQNLLGQSGQGANAAIDPKLLGSIGKVAGMLNKPDRRCDFLLALKPLLGPDRQRRVDEAVQMLRMITVLPQLRELGGKGL